MPHHQNRIFHGQTACPASDSGAREPDRRRGAPQLRIRHVHGRKRAVSFLNRFRTTTRHFCGVSTPALRLYSASLSWAVKLDSSLLCFAEHSNLFWPDLRLPHALRSGFYPGFTRLLYFRIILSSFPWCSRSCHGGFRWLSLP